MDHEFASTAKILQDPCCVRSESTERMGARSRLSFTAVAFSLAAGVVGVAAREGPPAPATRQEAVQVETRATFRSVTEEDGGQRVYVHLKVVPRAKLPFTTLRFRVRDRALLAGLREGASVKFRAERVEGENTLLAIRAVPPCVRFQPCD
jgi:Cu/Ag efflux protein CusF